MNRILVYIALLIGYVGFSQENPVSIKTDTTSIRIGEQIQYKISVSEVDQVVFPELKMDSLRKIEVRGKIGIPEHSGLTFVTFCKIYGNRMPNFAVCNQCCQ